MQLQTGGSVEAIHLNTVSVSGAQYNQSPALAGPTPGCNTLQPSTVQEALRTNVTVVTDVTDILMFHSCTNLQASAVSPLSLFGIVWLLLSMAQ